MIYGERKLKMGNVQDFELSWLTMGLAHRDCMLEREG